MRKPVSSHKTCWIVLSCVLLVLFLILTGLLISDCRMERKRENSYMRVLYYDLRDIAAQAKVISEMDSFEGDGLLALYHLRVLLHTTDEDFVTHSVYLKEQTPAAVGIWFSQRSAILQQLCQAEHIDTEKVKNFALRLQTDVEAMFQPFVGDDGLNFNDDMTIEEFTSTISEVHSERQDVFH